MDNKAYIESGILESYALGLCSEAEALEVENACQTHPEIQAELIRIQQSINDYAQLHSKTPKPSTRQSFLNAIDEELAATTNKTIQKIPFFYNPIAIAASLLLLALSVIGNIFFYQKWQAANQQVLALNSEKQLMAEQLQTNKVNYEAMKNDLAVMSNPNVVKVMMKGVEKSPESLAMVYWNKQSKEVFIELKSLPTPQPGMQYQLWAIVNGKPVDAGMIAMQEGDSSLHSMKSFETAQAFAITLERQGGSPTPTLTEMYVMGAVNL